MKTKLTISIDQHIKDKARKYAKDSGRSLSEIIENYLKAITSDGSKSESGETPVVKSLKGSFKEPAEFEYKNDLTKALNEKYC